MNSRSPMVIGTVIVVVLIGLGVLALSRTGSGAPAAAPPTGPTATPSQTAGTPTTAPDPAAVRSDQGSTVLEARVTDCEQCQLTAHSAVAPNSQNEWSATVDGGVAMIELPTPNTLGLTFLLQAEKSGEDTPARTVVILQPTGVASGQPVSETTFDSSAKGRYCWAGTTLDTAVVQLTAKTAGADVSKAWANPALATLPPTYPTKNAQGAKQPLACAAAAK